jgi:hypothetical protein
MPRSGGEASTTLAAESNPRCWVASLHPDNDDLSASKVLSLTNCRQHQLQTSMIASTTAMLPRRIARAFNMIASAVAEHRTPIALTLAATVRATNQATAPNVVRRSAIQITPGR